MEKYTKNKLDEKNQKFLDAEAVVSGQTEIIGQRFP